jgi:hypothetical protein
MTAEDEKQEQEPIYVEFKAVDPTDPFQFSKRRKWM